MEARIASTLAGLQAARPAELRELAILYRDAQAAWRAEVAEELWRRGRAFPAALPAGRRAGARGGGQRVARPCGGRPRRAARGAVARGRRGLRPARAAARRRSPRRGRRRSALGTDPALKAARKPGLKAVASARAHPINCAAMPDERLIVALDLPDAAAARALADRLQDEVGFYKIGLGLLVGGGLDLARELKARGKRVFLDLKLFDIGATVEAAVRGIAGLGVDFLTVHGDPQVVGAAVRGRGDAPLRILAVTILTSLDRADLDAMLMAPGDAGRPDGRTGAPGPRRGGGRGDRLASGGRGHPGAACGGGAADRHAGRPPGRRSSGRPEAHRHSGRGDPRRRRPHRRRSADHRRGRSGRRGPGAARRAVGDEAGQGMLHP